MMQEINQRYRVQRKVGGGGMGIVYQAVDLQLGERLVAIKEMRQDHLDAGQLEAASQAFEKEAHLLAGLVHPNLPRILDHCSEDGKWYLVMDYIEGETLAEYQTQQGGKLSPEDVLEIGIQLCAVLQYLHTQRPQPIIFRDLKPSNVMLTPDGHLYLIDFGIARHFKGGQAQDTSAGWSIGYSPPEQSPGLYAQETTPQSDIYSLGATLHHLLTGSKPWLNTPSVFDFPPLSACDPSLPAALGMLIAQMLRVRREERPGSVAEVRGKLQEIAARRRSGDSTRPSDTTWGRPARSQEPAVRKSFARTGRVIVAILTIVLLGGSGLLLWTAVLQPGQLHFQSTATALAVLQGPCPDPVFVAEVIGESAQNISPGSELCSFVLQKVVPRSVHCPAGYGPVSFQYTVASGNGTQYIRACDGTETTVFTLYGATVRFVHWESDGDACTIYRKTPGAVLAPGTRCP